MVACPPHTFGFDVNVFLQNSNSVQRNHQGYLWYTYYDYWEEEMPDRFHTVSYNADTPAHVYTKLNEIVSPSVQRFGYARAPINVHSDDNDGQETSCYYHWPDEYMVIRHTCWTAFGPEQGTWVVAHEYGHAYQFGALRPQPGDDWPQCSNHTIGGQTDGGCAFMEGFADFFASWIYGDTLTTSSPGANWASDNATEINLWRTGGVRTEGSFAGFLYDLVDNTAERDDATNTGKFSEPFDPIAAAGYLISNVIRNCQLYSIPLARWKYVGRPREFIFCTENGLSAQNDPILESDGWQPYANLSGGLDGQYTSDVRRLWKYNFYNVQP
jgi:hypothetical protein